MQTGKAKNRISPPPPPIPLAGNMCFWSLLMHTPKLTYIDGSICFYTVKLMLFAQSCPTLCNPMGCSPPGSSVHRILQARILEWVAMPSSRGSSRPRDWTQVSCIAGRSITIWATREPKCCIQDWGKNIQNCFLDITAQVSCVFVFLLPEAGCSELERHVINIPLESGSSDTLQVWLSLSHPFKSPGARFMVEGQVSRASKAQMPGPTCKQRGGLTQQDFGRCNPGPDLRSDQRAELSQIYEYYFLSKKAEITMKPWLVSLCPERFVAGVEPTSRVSAAQRWKACEGQRLCQVDGPLGALCGTLTLTDSATQRVPSSAESLDGGPWLFDVAFVGLLGLFRLPDLSLPIDWPFQPTGRLLLSRGAAPCGSVQLIALDGSPRPGHFSPPLWPPILLQILPARTRTILPKTYNGFVVFSHSPDRIPATASHT